MLPDKDKVFEKDEKNHYLVETVVFDDIVSYLPIKNHSTLQKAIIKIDIEGFEPYAFENATKLFNKVSVEVVFIEWFHLAKQKDIYDKIENMINFLLSYELKPYMPEGKTILNVKEWTKWPIDVVWKKDGY